MLDRELRRLLTFVCLTLVVVGQAVAGSSNSLLDVSADGRLLACSNRDSGTVTIVDLEKFEKLREIKVGHKPEGVAFLARVYRNQEC